MKIDEVWKDITDYDGFYQISNLGNVKSLERVVVQSNGQAITIREKILKPQPNGDGYPRVLLYKDKKSNLLFVHKLLAKTFLDNPEKKKEVNHIDGTKSDNRIENLEWVTHSENQLHKCYVLSKNVEPVIQFDKQGNFIKEFPSINMASRVIGINLSNIHSACNEKRKTAGGYIWKYKKERKVNDIWSS